MYLVYLCPPNHPIRRKGQPPGNAEGLAIIIPLIRRQQDASPAPIGPVSSFAALREPAGPEELRREARPA